MNINSNNTNKFDSPRFVIPGTNFQIGLNVSISDKLSLIAIILFSLLMFYPGTFSNPPIDREETNFIVTSKQMLDSGDYLKIREHHNDEYKKTIGTYWLQVVSVKLFGSGMSDSLWAYRLPTFVGVIISILGIYWCVRAFTGPPQALLIALLVSTSALVGLFVRIANSEILLLACIVIAQGALARIWLQKNHNTLMLAGIFWIFFSGSMLVGGPFGPMVLLLTVFSLCFIEKGIGWVRNLKPILGVLFFIVSMIPLLVAINMEIYNTITVGIIVRDLLGKIGHGLEILGPPPLTHLLMMQFTFWPISVFAILVFPIVFRNWRDPVNSFFLAWGLSTWVILELVALKLPNYTLHILPAVASLTVLTLVNTEINWGIGKKIGAILMILVPMFLVVLSIVFPIFLKDNYSLFGIIFCISGFIVGVASTVQILKKKYLINAMILAIISAMLIFVGFFGNTLPALSSIRISEHLTKKISETINCSSPKFGSLGYTEPSLEYYLGNVVIFKNVEESVAWISQAGCRVAIIDDKNLNSFQELTKKYFTRPTKSSEVEGYNFNVGKKQVFNLFHMNNKGVNSPY